MKNLYIAALALAATIAAPPSGAVRNARTGGEQGAIWEEPDVRDAEIRSAVEKWNMGVKNVYWENYRGNNVRVEVLRNNRDLKEMRLKFVQSQDMVSNPDASISDMLANVAGKVMKSTCGRKAKQAIVLYERPSVELVKETTYDYYKIIARGQSIKEYGFRCIY